MDLAKALQARLATFHAAPFLFVGSGLSRRYLWLETWSDLLKKFCGQADIEFGYLASKANGDTPQVASLLAEEFHKKWWKNKRFEAHRKKFAGSALRIDSPLKNEISEYLKAKEPDADDDEMKSELEKLRLAVIDGIITTNWDLLLEQLFPEFVVYKGQQELLFSTTQGIAEIYKIHGCCSKPDSLVLTKEDYDRFNTRNPYLAATLLTIFMEHPVIFLGYSLSDPNILSILSSITHCLGREHLEKLRDRLIFVQWAKGQECELTTSMHNFNGSIIPITIIKCDSFLPVYEALAATKRKFPARILRTLKNHIYELIKENDPHGRLFVADLDNETSSSKIEIVYGVGTAAQMGQVGYARHSPRPNSAGRRFRRKKI